MSVMFRITRPISSLFTRTTIKPVLTLTIRSFAGGHAADRDHPHLGSPSPGYDTTQNTMDNPFLWDPHYNPSEESDWDRQIMEPYMMERYAIEKDQFMSKDDCLRRISKICSHMDRAQTEGKVVTANTHIYNDLGLDSLDQVEFGLALEEEFDIEIPDEEAEQIVTIGDAIELICDHPNSV